MGRGEKELSIKLHFFALCLIYVPQIESVFMIANSQREMAKICDEISFIGKCGHAMLSK